MAFSRQQGFVLPPPLPDLDFEAMLGTDEEDDEDKPIRVLLPKISQKKMGDVV
jgi:hypothetical protein